MEKKIKVYWLVLIVLGVIAIFVFIETANTDSNLVQYFGFAGSITSLVLGLVAIFYSIITNQSATENYGKLKEAVTKVEDGAKSIKDLSDDINKKLDKISDDLVRFGTKDNKDQSAPKGALESESPPTDDPTADQPDKLQQPIKGKKGQNNG